MRQLRNAEAAHDDATALNIMRRLIVVTNEATKEARALGWASCASRP